MKEKIWGVSIALALRVLLHLPSWWTFEPQAADDLNWEELHYKPHQNFSRKQYLESAVFGNGTWVAVGDFIYTSTNGVDWISIGQYVPKPNLLKVIYAKDKFVAVAARIFAAEREIVLLLLHEMDLPGKMR